jgi:sugar O-acyltransferase (sialic acid O-acetyltransferase NeuD family)
MKHIIVGTGGLAKQALSSFPTFYKSIYYVNTPTEEKEFFGSPIINSLENIEDFVFSVCIGNPIWRAHFYEEMKKIGGIPLNVIGNYSSISDPSMDKGNMILQYVLVEPKVKIGKGNLFNCYSGIFHDVEIGDFNEIMPGAKILGGAKIGNMCRIGTNSTILPNIKICDNVIIGAGAVVTKDIDVPGTYVGIPAKRIK